MTFADLRLRDVLVRNAEIYRADRAVGFDGQWVTWGDLAERVFRLANQMACAGVERGSRVGVLQRNGPEIAEIYFAAAVLGAVAVPISPRLTVDEVAYVARDAELAFAFVEDGHPAGGAVEPARTVRTRAAEYVDFRDAGDAHEPASGESADDPVFQLYTSGTTGRPKGAVVSQSAMIQNGLTILVAQQLRHDDVFLSATPLTHAASGTRVFSMAVDGIAHAILERYTIDGFIEAVERDGVTTTILVPAMVQDLLRSPHLDPARLTSLRSLVYGAAPMPVAVIQEALDRLPCGLIQGYGQTEAGTALTVLTAEEHRRFAADPALHHRLASVGRAAPGVRFRVVDDSGAPVGPDQPGEILVRGVKTMTGYWRLPDATAAADRDGWLATGDVGCQDRDGYLYLIDRRNDTIISGGLNVYPSEIERVVRSDAAVQDAAVVGVPDERWGETPVAFVVSTDPDVVGRLRATCRELLAGYKQPREFRVVEGLPRNPTGKVLRAELRRWAQDMDVTSKGDR